MTNVSSGLGAAPKAYSPARNGHHHRNVAKRLSLLLALVHVVLLLDFADRDDGDDEDDLRFREVTFVKAAHKLCWAI